MEKKFSIGLIEDDLIYAESFAALVKTFKEYEFIGHVTSMEEALNPDVFFLADIYIVDHGLPGIKGINGIPMIRSRYPESKVIIFTVFDDEEKLFLALKYGASGYILKNDNELRILNALNEVNEGGMLFSPAMAQKVLKFFKRKKDKNDCITAREKDVLQLLKKGCSKKEISSELNISYNTVDSHVKNIYKKLHVNDKTKAVMKALDDDIIN